MREMLEDMPVQLCAPGGSHKLQWAIKKEAGTVQLVATGGSIELQCERSWKMC